MGKLTPTQRRHLEAIRDGRNPDFNAASPRIRRELKARGLWFWDENSRYVLTDAGRAALAQPTDTAAKGGQS